MIFVHLPHAFRHGSDLLAREKMALASTYAGLAFTRANVGNVHAIAHQLGGRYHVPHGLANAVLLPHVLRFSLPASKPRLARLAGRIGLKATGDKALAAAFVDAVQALNDMLEIPRTLAALQAADIPALAKAACWEADANYPVPRRMSQGDCEALLHAVLPTAVLPRARRAAKKARQKA
jgi:alcohol dehydrogenase class IV